MFIVDMHAHITPPEVIQNRDAYLERDLWFRTLYSAPRSRLVTAEQLVAAMDDSGIDMAVVFGFAWADEELCARDNDYVAEAVRAYPDRLIGFALVNPNSGDRAIREMERCAAMGLRGVGELMPDGQSCPLDTEPWDPLMAWLAERGFPLITHSCEPVGHEYAGKGGTHPDAVYRLAGRHPENLIIAAHWGGGLPFYEFMPKARAELRNVYYDVAAAPYLYDSKAYAAAMLAAPLKMCFATDYPLLGYPRCLAHVRAAELSPEDEAALLGENALRLLRMDRTQPSG